MAVKTLLVEDDIAFGKMISTFLTRNDHVVLHVTTLDEAKDLLSKETFNICITDLQLPDGSGLDLLAFAKQKYAQLPVVMMTGYGDVSTAVSAIKKGAFDYISKPFRPEELLMTVQEALKALPKQKENHIKTPPELVSSPPNAFVTGIDKRSKQLNEHIALVGPTQMSVLIQGENGTGKEVAAKAIHNASTRAQDAFIAVDCGAIPKEIATSEFFGHVKGSFTGAIEDKKGYFQAAHGGTLFLDEVGNLSYENQIQLLRALQERQVKPVGSNVAVAVDIRVISATNEALREAVADGTFREDLFHRLNEFSVEIPPLRERKEDLLFFIDAFLREANELLNKNVVGVSKEVMIAFRAYHWPGNLRELKNVIKRAVLLTEGTLILLDVIPREVLQVKDKESKLVDFSKSANEKQLILNALAEAGQNKSKAAILLEMSRKTLYNKMEQYGIDR